MYDRWRARLRELDEGSDKEAPDFATFWAAGEFELPAGPEHYTMLERFRADPDGAPLRTPTGRIEISSARIASFGYSDCPGHPVWLDSLAASGRHPLHLLANQPDTRLHSQLDVGALSQKGKIAGREPIRLHPEDAAARGVAAGEVVRVFNDRGACLAGAVLTDALRPGVVQIATGAWFDPVPDDHPYAPLCAHGNPNALTADAPTSRLSQGCSGAHTLVQVERYVGPLPPVTVTALPPIAPLTA
jgi:biotin/methionine sulfoxide reductase